VAWLGCAGKDGVHDRITQHPRERDLRHRDAALNAEMTEHLGHEKHQAEAGRASTNVRNGTRPKTVVSG